MEYYFAHSGSHSGMMDEVTTGHMDYGWAWLGMLVMGLVITLVVLLLIKAAVPTKPRLAKTTP